MNKWAIRALGGAACTAGFLALGLGIASADEPNHPSGSADISAKNPLGSATSGLGEAVGSALHSTKNGTAADRHGSLEIKLKLGDRADRAPATPDRPATRAAHKAPPALKITVRVGASHGSGHGHRQHRVDPAPAHHPVHSPGGAPSGPADG